MCGIFGVFYTDQAFERMVQEIERPSTAPKSAVRPHELVLAELAPENLKRGNKAFGYFAWREDMRFARRFIVPYTLDSITALRMKSLVVHNRAPTEGDPSDYAQVHPYETKYGHLFMNGILLNHLDGVFAGRKTHSSPVDTAYLAGNIDYWTKYLREAVDDDSKEVNVVPMEYSLGTAVSEFKGQQACVFIEPKWGITYLWRVMSTLYFGAFPSKGYSVVSSSKIDGVAETLLKEGVVYTLDRNRCALVAAQTFGYESIYESK